MKKRVRMRKVVEEWRQKEKCIEVSEEVVCKEREEDRPVIVTIRSRGCQQMQTMSSNPSAKCFYHTEKFLW